MLGLPATLIQLLLMLSFVSGGPWTGTNQSCHVLQSHGLAWSAEISEPCLLASIHYGQERCGVEIQVPLLPRSPASNTNLEG